MRQRLGTIVAVMGLVTATAAPAQTRPATLDLWAAGKATMRHCGAAVARELW